MSNAIIVNKYKNGFTTICTFSFEQTEIGKLVTPIELPKFKNVQLKRNSLIKNNVARHR